MGPRHHRHGPFVQEGGYSVFQRVLCTHESTSNFTQHLPVSWSALPDPCSAPYKHMLMGKAAITYSQVSDEDQAHQGPLDRLYT